MLTYMLRMLRMSTLTLRNLVTVLMTLVADKHFFKNPMLWIKTFMVDYYYCVINVAFRTIKYHIYLNFLFKIAFMPLESIHLKV